MAMRLYQISDLLVDGWHPQTRLRVIILLMCPSAPLTRRRKLSKNVRQRFSLAKKGAPVLRIRH